MAKGYTKSRITVIHRGCGHTRMPNNDLYSGLKELSPHAFRLFAYYLNKDGWWEFKKEVMLLDLNIKDRTFINAKKELKDKGYLFILVGEIDQYFVGKEAVKECLENMK